MNPDNCKINQGFGVNPATYGPALAGHPGVDEQCGYGTPIHSPVNMHVYKVLTKERPSNDGSGFTGVFGIVDNDIECYELLIGHCNPMVVEGQNIALGQMIGTEANHGLVFNNGVQITLAMQAAGDQRGTHRHVQKRPVMKSPKISQPALSAYNDVAGTYRDAEGNYYPIWHYHNGYNGCIDPAKPVFQRDLNLGNEGYDVWVLQRILAKEGVFSVAPTGFFGNVTRQALATFQAKEHLEPTAGYFGPKTRTLLINRYSL